MKNKGGYKVINFKDTDLTIGSVAVSVPGLYSAIESAYRKPCIATGLHIGGVERHDCFVNFYGSSGHYEGILFFHEYAGEKAIITVEVTDADMVRVIKNVI